MYETRDFQARINTEENFQLVLDRSRYSAEIAKERERVRRAAELRRRQLCRAASSQLALQMQGGGFLAYICKQKSRQTLGNG